MRVRRIIMQLRVIAAISALVTAPAMADSVENMCLNMHKSEQVCQCAIEQLKTQLGDEDYDLYEGIGADYTANLDTGMARSDAWDGAVKKEAANLGVTYITLLKRTNTMGAAHNKAIKDCSD
jgi:hypothetical protein